MVRAVVLAESPIGTLTLRIRSTFFVACLWVGHILSNRDHVRFCAICLPTNNVKFNPIEDASRAILCRAIGLRTFLGFFLGRTVDLATALVLAIFQMQLFLSARISHGTSRSSSSMQESVALLSWEIPGLTSGQACESPWLNPVRQYLPQGHLVNEKFPAFS